MIASGEAEYGGVLVNGKVVKRELPKHLGGKNTPRTKLPPLPADATPEERLAMAKAQLSQVKGQELASQGQESSPKADRPLAVDEPAPLPGSLQFPPKTEDP